MCKKITKIFYETKIEKKNHKEREENTKKMKKHNVV